MSVWLWLLAVLPIALLVTLVITGRARTIQAAMLTLAIACIAALWAFQTEPAGLGIALAKGLWTGFWISAVIWAALLLNTVSTKMGVRDIGGRLGSILPKRTQNILIVAWIFPSFVQGVAGFGTPIALAAPILLTMGVRPVMAVALPLIGYHWSVGFGSVGSSFYMGALTAQLTRAEIGEFAATLSLLLGINVVLAGVFVALLFGGKRGLREAWLMIVIIGPAMAMAQALAVRLEPGVGALAGGTAGLAITGVMALIFRTRRAVPESVASAGEAGDVGRAPAVEGRSDGVSVEPDVSQDGLRGNQATDLATVDAHVGKTAAHRRRRLGLGVVMLPYFALLVLTLAVLVPETSREWVREHLTWGPSLPGHSTGRDFQVEPVVGYQPFSLLSHPGSFIVAATLLAVLSWKIVGQWPKGGVREVFPMWFTQARKATWSVVLFACLATVLADTGMVRTIADGIAQVTGNQYPALAGAIGALGSFTTGSSTNSNALFSALQADLAHLIDVPPAILLAAQTAGANVGNALAPVILLLGASAVGLRDQLRPIFTMVAIPVVVLLVAVLGLTYLTAILW